ncbi:hypothetical protein VNI00_001466 [Paramarasmius palmivorus]|uniref:Uncharacterized protein n=1 Tax=Paramarasmius palmivorus TaxID=297713 RepID=A0AAW0E4P4_9AGAR
MASLDNFKLVLSNDSAIESVLSEIPFFCVGLVAFAISTFFLVMKRINLLGAYLYASAIFAFAGAILDLSQILARGATNVEQGLGMDSVTAIINTREVGLALSVGFRFLFFWTFIAERPRGEPPPSALDDPGFYNAREYAHSASWKRWGIFGFFLKWSLLAASLAIPILQIIWRIAIRKFGIVYMVESAIEIIVSALFLLKIFLNILLSPRTPRWGVLVTYIAPLLALVINLGLGIGQLLLFLFTETTLGRFLQAVELYVLMLFILIISFYKMPVRPARSRGPNTASYVVSTDEKPWKSPIQTPATNDPPPFVGEEVYGNNIREVRRSRQSDNSRLSSWIFARRSSGRPPSGIRWLVNRDDPELGPAQTQPGDTIGTQNDTGPENNVTSAEQTRPPPPVIEPPDEEPGGDLLASSLVPPERRRSTISFSYYGLDRGSRLSIPMKPREDSRIGADSPVYGLDGIVNLNSRNEQRESTGRVSPQGSLNSIEELLRQQNELDKSIATLRLFSTSTAPSSELGPDLDSDQRVRSSGPSRPALSSTLTGRTYSTHSSTPSELSLLSRFPEPPRPSVDDAPPFSARQSLATVRSKRAPTTLHRGTLSDPISEALGGPPISVPNSPTRQRGRFDSAGTQYDVTSFIGDLTAPAVAGHRPTSSFNRNAPSLSDVESEDETTTIMTARSKQSLRPVIVDTATLSNPSSVPDQEEQEQTIPPRTYGPPALKPLLLGNVTSLPSVSSPLAAGAQSLSPDSSVPRRPFRGRYALPSGPRLQISGPRPPNTDGELESAAYERPRPPPQFNSSRTNR